MSETPEIACLERELLGCMDRYQKSAQTASEISVQLAELSKARRLAVESSRDWSTEEISMESQTLEVRRKLFVMASAMEAVAGNAERFAEVIRLYGETFTES